MKPGMPTLFSAYKKTSDITATDHCASERDSDHQSLRKSFWCCSQHRTFDSSCIGKNDAGSINRSEKVNGIMADNFEKGIKEPPLYPGISGKWKISSSQWSSL